MILSVLPQQRYSPIPRQRHQRCCADRQGRPRCHFSCNVNAQWYAMDRNQAEHRGR